MAVTLVGESQHRDIPREKACLSRERNTLSLIEIVFHFNYPRIIILSFKLDGGQLSLPLEIKNYIISALAKLFKNEVQCMLECPLI